MLPSLSDDFNGGDRCGATAELDAPAPSAQAGRRRVRGRSGPGGGAAERWPPEGGVGRAALVHALAPCPAHEGGDGHRAEEERAGEIRRCIGDRRFENSRHVDSFSPWLVRESGRCGPTPGQCIRAE